MEKPSDSNDFVIKNLNEIKLNITKAIENSFNREVYLVGVTKTVSVENINLAIDNGLNIIGENKVQEFLSKIDDYKKNNLKIHFIGHLQSNKVKYIIDKVDVIESVNSLKLIETINKLSYKFKKKTDIFLEINVGEEQSKSGANFSDIINMLNFSEKYDNIHIVGFMAIPPYDSDPEKSRPYFKLMKSFFDEQKQHNRKNVDLKFLSMGMSNDYIQAIEEGANIVRIGSLLFGKRNY